MKLIKHLLCMLVASIIAGGGTYLFTLWLGRIEDEAVIYAALGAPISYAVCEALKSNKEFN